MDSNQILSDDKNLQVFVKDGPNMRPTNPRWRMAAILKNHHISPTVWPILTKFGMVMHLGPTHPSIKNFFVKLI